VILVDLDLRPLYLDRFFSLEGPGSTWWRSVAPRSGTGYGYGYAARAYAHREEAEHLGTKA